MIEHANTAAIESSARTGAWIHDSSTGSMLISEATLPSSVWLVF
jgi:hypothetical protein